MDQGHEASACKGREALEASVRRQREIDAENKALLCQIVMAGKEALKEVRVRV